MADDALVEGGFFEDEKRKGEEAVFEENKYRSLQRQLVKRK